MTRAQNLKQSSESDVTKGVYSWVPVQVVTNVIAKHGGMVSGEVPDGVIPLTAIAKMVRQNIKGNR